MRRIKNFFTAVLITGITVAMKLPTTIFEMRMMPNWEPLAGATTVNNT